MGIGEKGVGRRWATRLRGIKAPGVSVGKRETGAGMVGRAAKEAGTAAGPVLAAVVKFGTRCGGGVGRLKSGEGGACRPAARDGPHDRLAHGIHFFVAVK